MATQTEANLLRDRWAHLRSHQRVETRVKFQVEWDEGKTKQTVNAFTVDVSESGCKAVVSGELPMRRLVRLIHRDSGRSAEAQVVWRGHEAWDIGLEFVKPDPSFWGVKFDGPVPAGSSKPTR